MTDKTPSKLRVAMISYYFYPEYSGSAKQAATLIRALKQKNVDSLIISAQLEPTWPLQETIEEIDVNRVPLKNPKSIVGFWIGIAKMTWKLRSKIDIIHTHGMNPYHGFPLFWGKLLRKPTIGKLSIAKSDIKFENQGRIMGRLHRFFLKFADRYVSISSEITEEIKNSGLPFRKCTYIPNGVDTKKFYPVNGDKKLELRRELGFNETDIIVLFVGVFDARKGTDILIPAFKSALDKLKNLRLLLVGPINRADAGGAYYSKLVDLTKSLGIEKWINFYDKTDQIHKFYQLADIFVLPSRQEGMPNVLIEAMANGLPVIGTKISGTMDLIEHGKNGILVKKEDIEELAGSIVTLADSLQLREQFSRENVKRINKSFSMDIVSEQYLEQYKLIK